MATRQRSKLADVMILLGLVFLPAVGLIWLQSLFGWDISWIIPIVMGLDMLFAFEVIAIRQSREFVWTSLATLRDKSVLAVALVILLLIGVWPIQQRIEPFVVQLALFALACAIAIAILYLFGSKEMKSKLLRRTPIESDDK